MAGLWWSRRVGTGGDARIKGTSACAFKCVECMPVWLLAWGNGSRTARGGLGCRSQAGLLGLNGEGVGRRACDSAECLRVGAGVSLAGGNGVVGSRRVWLAISARAGHLSRTDARSLRPIPRACNPVVPPRPGPGRSCATSCRATDARCRARARWLMSAATACCCPPWPPAQRGCCLLPAPCCRRRLAMGGVEIRIRAGTGPQRAFITPVSARNVPTPHVRRAGRVRRR